MKANIETNVERKRIKKAKVRLFKQDTKNDTSQDRICMSGGEEGTPPPPPFPMKIAPPDKRDGDPDQQFIR